MTPIGGKQVKSGRYQPSREKKGGGGARVWQTERGLAGGAHLDIDFVVCDYFCLRGWRRFPPPLVISHLLLKLVAEAAANAF